MEENKGGDETDQQKKVSFEKDEGAQKDRKEHDEHDEEGRRSRISRASRSSSAAYDTDGDTQLKGHPKEVTVKEISSDKNNDADDSSETEEVLKQEMNTTKQVTSSTRRTNDTSENKSDEEKEAITGESSLTKDESKDTQEATKAEVSYNQLGYSLNSRQTKVNTVEENTDSEEKPKRYLTDDEKLADFKSQETAKSPERGNMRQLNWEESRDRHEPRERRSRSSSSSSTSSSSCDSKSEASYKQTDVSEKKVVTQMTIDQSRENNQQTGFKNKQPTKVVAVAKPSQKPDNKPKSKEEKENKPTTRKYVPPTTPKGYKPSATRWHVKDSVNPTPEELAKERLERRQKAHSARYPSHGDATFRSASRASTCGRSGSRSSGPPSRARTTLGFSERRRKEREFFHAELQRLKDSLRKESKKIKKPKVRDHYPDVFTSLAPYYDTYTANYLIKMPDLGYKETQPAEARKPEHTDSETKDLMYTTRCTSIGLCDPWDSLNMDRSVLPKLETAEIRRRRIEQMHAMEHKPKSGRASNNTDRNSQQDSSSPNTEKNLESSPRQKRPEAKMGSTRLPKFPVIHPPNSDITTKELHWNDVPMLRDEMIKSFSHFGEGRRKADYERTRQDFYRMELDRLNEYHHTTRPHMRAAYFAYLQNTPGSRKAIYDCIKEVTTQKEKEEPAPQAVA